MTNVALPASVARAASQPNDDKRVQEAVSAPAVYIPIVVALIGIGGLYLNHWLTKRRESVTRLADASKDFRAAFADELAVLESNRDPYFDIQAFLLSAYDTKHRAAIALFEGFVSTADRTSFKATWDQYHSGQQAGGEPLDMFAMGSPYKEAMFIEYSGSPFTHPTMGARELAIHRMRKLLAYAKHD